MSTNSALSHALSNWRPESCARPKWRSDLFVIHRRETADQNGELHFLLSATAWRLFYLFRPVAWSVVKYGGQGQSGQAIKLLQAPRKISFDVRFWQVFHVWWCETGRVIKQQFSMKEFTFYGVKTYSAPSYIFSGGHDPTPRIYAVASGVTTSNAHRLWHLWRPCDLDLWPVDLESGIPVRCDVRYLCANFSLRRPASLFST